METNVMSIDRELTDADTKEYEERRKAMDPEPWIKPATMERFSSQPQHGFSVYHPRINWPECGGRMVRRDYLRTGDIAVSSHYGKRIVRSVSVTGTEGQTTTIFWDSSTNSCAPSSETYESSSMIELLSSKERVSSLS